MNLRFVGFTALIHSWAVRLPTIAVVLTVLMPIANAQASPEVQKVSEAGSPALVLELRSPFDGRLVTATEYVELQAEIDRLNEVSPQVSPKIRRLVGLLKFRKFIKRVLPIVPIK